MDSKIIHHLNDPLDYTQNIDAKNVEQLLDELKRKLQNKIEIKISLQQYKQHKAEIDRNTL